MGCFWGCGNNCGCNGNNNCGCNCNGNNDCDHDDEVACAEKVRRAYWAGFKAGCNDPRCHHHHHDDDC